MSSKLLLLVLIVLLSGCISEKKNTEVVNNMQISISSNAFKEGDFIPAEYSCEGKDISPALSWEGIPDGTESIALIVEDPDAPMGTFVHWVLYNIPPEKTSLPEAVPKDETLSDGSMQGRNDFGRIGYNGPCPPPGKPHRYYFRIYALDTKLDLLPGASKAEVEKAMKGHVLAKGELMGRYSR